MRVLFAASECAPIVKVGGLADVVGGLPKALKKLGVEVAVVIPRYENIRVINVIKIITIIVSYAGKSEQVLVYQTKLPETDIPVFLLENKTYLSTGPVYSARSAEGNPLDIDRFSFFSKAVVEFLGVMTGKRFDIIHCHDWHTAWIPLLIQNSKFKIQNCPKTLLTIHNLGKMYQGRTDKSTIKKLENQNSNFQLQNPASNIQLPSSNDEVNILLQGIVNADLITTVSPTYAKEIQTKEYGEDLHDVLKQYSSKLTGILNGVDYEVWNLETDGFLEAKYSSNLSNLSNWQEGKAKNKNLLLSKVGLPAGENIPLFGMVTRIASQKGFDILLPALASRAKLVGTNGTNDLRVIILGVGDPDLEVRIKKLEAGYKGKLKFITRFDEALAHLIYAGSDFFLMPSKFEPCGLTQLIAMHYGSLPIVRKVGGLADSVEEGITGFVFEEYAVQALSSKLEQALTVYRIPYTVYQKMVENAMAADFSWDSSAKEYLQLYEKLV